MNYCIFLIYCCNRKRCNVNSRRRNKRSMVLIAIIMGPDQIDKMIFGSLISVLWRKILLFSHSLLCNGTKQICNIIETECDINDDCGAHSEVGLTVGQPMARLFVFWACLILVMGFPVLTSAKKLCTEAEELGKKISCRILVVENISFSVSLCSVTKISERSTVYCKYVSKTDILSKVEIC